MADVRENPERSQYEVTVDGTLAGLAHYVTKGEGRVFDHTEIEPAFEGKGIGSLLARGALDDVIARGIPFAATCPFIVSFLERHPEYGEKVDPSLG
jgi:predicted GNAT family acetyltransferase